MASEKAKAAAQKVVETLGTGKAPVLGKVLREVGYSDNTADNPKAVTSTKTYQNEIKSFVDQLEEERQRILTELKIKDLDKVQYDRLVSSMDTMTKNIQLLTGKETERAGVTINVVSYDSSNDTPSLQA